MFFNPQTTWHQRLRHVHNQHKQYYPTLALIIGLSVFALSIRLSVSNLNVALGPYEYFFQLILAAAVLSLVRNELGVSTYGLFAPAIIAFILLAVGPFWGIIFFLNIFVLALVTYVALAPLQLAKAPRVAILVTVACLTTLSILLSADLDLLPNFFATSDVFFPSIISAWYADQFASEVEERGWTAPAIQFLWTLGAILVAYAVISTEQIISWFTTTPEAWVALIIGIVALGSQPTLRMNEYVRFTDHLGNSSLDAAITALRVTLYNLQARLVGSPTESPAKLRMGDVLPKKKWQQYIESYNPPHLRPGADEKALMNVRLNGIGIGAPETYMIVESLTELEDAANLMAKKNEFVIKPSSGYGGEGIIVVSNRLNSMAPDTPSENEITLYDTSKGEATQDELLKHIRGIVQGHYSGLKPGGTAIIEERLIPAPFFMELCGQGVPDIRVIVFQGYPVMTMTRLPTVESEGAANLHQGGIGVGLRVADGTPIKAYQQSRDRWLDRHPDTGADLTDFTIPNWTVVLDTATRAAAASGLTYAGVDIVLDEHNTPRVLEVNVRPGLGIQNTTEVGILRPLEYIESLPREYMFKPPAEKVRLAREWDERNWEKC